MKSFLAMMIVTLLPIAAYAAEALDRLLLTVPPEQRIVIPAVGKALANLVVFVDIDCPYCMQLHGMSDAVTERGIEIHYIFYPRSGPSADSYFQAVAVWCSGDRLAALEKAFRGEQLPVTNCDHPLLAHYELAIKLGLKGTPAIITPDGAIAYGVPSRTANQDSAAAQQEAQPR